MAKNKSEVRTEHSINDLLNIQGWHTGRPPKGSVVRQNEYKAFPQIAEIFKGKSKTQKGGDGYPDFLIIDNNTLRPLMVIEAKADENDLSDAINEAQWYANACREAGHEVIAIGIAGQEKTEVAVSVQKHYNGDWRKITYQGKPISWIPNSKDLDNILSVDSLIDLAPTIPRPEVLAEKADLINRILREAAIKDEYRPAHVGAMMLALWQTKGKIRKDPDYVLSDINRACKQAFNSSGKSHLALEVNEENVKLANSSWEILATLEKLNVVTAILDHDYLGQLYETFFRYTGGNTIGQYFTPRHVTRFMADICQTTPVDKVIDPACGTGGFLIACIQRAVDVTNAKYEDVIDMVKHNLYGYEAEPLTASLCVANMILRGDGKSGINKSDVFKATNYPTNDCDVALMNPPFPHKKTDIPPQLFIEKALEALKNRGKLAVILPTSYLVKREYEDWREKVLQKNTLLAVCELPDEIFQPFASATTAVVVLEKGIPHSKSVATSFVRIHYDGLTLKKGVRVTRLDGRDQMQDAVGAVINKTETPGFSGVAHMSGGKEWAPGAYVPSGIPSEDELKDSIDELLRRHASFYTRYALEIANQRKLVDNEELNVDDYRKLVSKARLENANESKVENDTIGHFFDILYGQKELHSRDGIPPGDSLIISPTEKYNGTYDWLTFEPLLKPPFVTVAQTGSIGEAFVQTEPCGVNDDCLVLLPKSNLPLSCLFIAAATIRLERWRFSYGRKLTPSRIKDFKMIRDSELEIWAEEKIRKWNIVSETAVQVYG